MWNSDFICVVGERAAVQPTEDNVVVNSSSSTVRSLKVKITAEVPIAAAPAPSAMAKRATAKAVEKLSRAEKKRYQKGVDNGRLSEKEYDTTGNTSRLRKNAAASSSNPASTRISVISWEECTFHKDCSPIILVTFETEYVTPRKIILG